MVTFERALIIALKIIAVNIVFGILVALVTTMNLMGGIVFALALSPIAMAVTVYFILDEAENILLPKLSSSMSQSTESIENLCGNCTLFRTLESKRNEKRSTARPCSDYLGKI